MFIRNIPAIIVYVHDGCSYVIVTRNVHWDVKRMIAMYMYPYMLFLGGTDSIILYHKHLHFDT